MPATSSKVMPTSSWAYILPRLRPKAIGEPAPPSRRIMIMKITTNRMQSVSIGRYVLNVLGASSALKS